MGQDIISGFINHPFPEELAGKHRKGVTAPDLLPSRDSIYVKIQASPQRPLLLNPSVLREQNLPLGHCTGTWGSPMSIPCLRGLRESTYKLENKSRNGVDACKRHHDCFKGRL